MMMRGPGGAGEMSGDGVQSFNLFRGDTNCRVCKHGLCVYARSSINCIQVEVGSPNAVGLQLIDYYYGIVFHIQRGYRGG